MKHVFDTRSESESVRLFSFGLIPASLVPLSLDSIEQFSCIFTKTYIIALQLVGSARDRKGQKYIQDGGLWKTSEPRTRSPSSSSHQGSQAGIRRQERKG